MTRRLLLAVLLSTFLSSAALVSGFAPAEAHGKHQIQMWCQVDDGTLEHPYPAPLLPAGHSGVLQTLQICLDDLDGVPRPEIIHSDA